jgi:hypothetical protein
MKFSSVGKYGQFPVKTDTVAPSATSAFSRERQLHDFRRANGLCYFRGDKFEAGHVDKCPKRPKPHLNVLCINDLDVELTEEKLKQLEAEDDLLNNLCNLSLNAISGTDPQDCMWVRALVKNQVMLILIDSGSSHSSIDSSFANRVNLSIQPMSPVPVHVANGATMTCNSIIPSLDWWVQGHTFSSRMRVLDMGAYDAILGYDWLSAHNPMVCDWQSKTIEFVDAGVKVSLSGVQSPDVHISELSVEQFEKWYKGNDIWSLAVVQCCSTAPSDNAPKEVRSLIDEFQDIFADPSSLPHAREFDHTISLLPDAVPVNSRPYRYSPLHKSEIERQVKELL